MTILRGLNKGTSHYLSGLWSLFSLPLYGKLSREENIPIFGNKDLSIVDCSYLRYCFLLLVLVLVNLMEICSQSLTGPGFAIFVVISDVKRLFYRHIWLSFYCGGSVFSK